MKIAVIVPAHNEAQTIEACLESIFVAADVAATHGHTVDVYIVCDSCTDETRERVLALGARALIVNARNVGLARAHGAEVAISEGAQWLACTDADSTVSPRWIVDQIALSSEVVCGTVQVNDWGIYGDAMRKHFSCTYFDVEGHRHIHGANLGLCAIAYRAAGGFSPLEHSEDVDLVSSLERMGAKIAWTAIPRVVTSARIDFRASIGFGATLAAVASRQRDENRLSN